ncbi:F-box only protein 32 isoform X2 [Condylostylus longicornis]|uniref:F-box only protein 32 isoform X2 n=1 Tax=Condylostylus longicornis TaxID=2530218 RepID=UPI00244DFBD4|nr:F-box only protein 32 isoform X2 [Condylostylus longicornis]
MPFISKDWRSPGEAWVKLEDGNWEKLKVLECGKRKRIPSTSEDDENTDVTAVPPHCHITIRCTKEIAGFNGLGDAVQRLDFRSSVRDRRRFHYICTLLGLIVTGKGIASLPGSAQRLLLQMVEEVASHVSDSQQNINVLRGLVIQLQQIVNQENQKCWGKPLGSQNLWLEHKQTIERIQSMTSQIQITPDSSIRPRMTDLPEECIREIILRIADYRDLEATSKAWNVMSALVNEQRIWRELTGFHFNKNQVNFILDKNKSRIINDAKDWKKVFHDLRKAYGEREDHQFIEILSLCRFCCCLFWPSDGHPCIIDQCPDLKQRLTEAGEDIKLSQPVPPAQFLKFFSL